MHSKSIAFVIAALLVVVGLADAPDTTNTVMMVDQWGNLNVAGVASVSDVATNAVNVQIAAAKADAAQTTAQSVTNKLNGIVANIVANNTIIYRSGYVDSFEGLVVFSTNDTMVIFNYQNMGITDGKLKARIDYVATVDLGATKPAVHASDTLENGTDDFEQVDSSNVDTPIQHAESVVFNGYTYTKWYELYVYIPVSGTPASYFYYIKIDADTPSGDGSALDLPNGVFGGLTVDKVWGDKVMHFKGGLLKGWSNVSSD